MLRGKTVLVRPQQITRKASFLDKHAIALDHHVNLFFNKEPYIFINLIIIHNKLIINFKNNTLIIYIWIKIYLYLIYFYLIIINRSNSVTNMTF